MKTWLKYGLIGCVLYPILIYLFEIINLKFLQTILLYNIVASIAKSFNNILFSIDNCTLDSCNPLIFYISMTSGITLSIIFGFIIGAIIGLIVNKIKRW